ncbi:hypothetical protein [Pectobacterium parmentieri]|uniref:hypothetical protein n=1 Tax=Pectobacterium parmentieri TaxID=1905730 RepID=UPI000D61EF75|nr:hypothetical protein [Pectobacterium parmentieri]PWD66538.1 hypothetical protein DF211_01940 [Pectobacterium parmentieri]
MAYDYYKEMEKIKLSQISERDRKRYLKYQAVVKGAIAAIDLAEKGIPHPQIIDREKTIDDAIDRNIAAMELAKLQQERINLIPKRENIDTTPADPYSWYRGHGRENWTGD